MNWKSYTEKLNAKTFVLPDGWDSKDRVATQLDCSSEKVDDHLRPALKSGAVIKQQFKVWDDALKRNIMVWAYQETASNEEKVKLPPGINVDLDTIKRMKQQGLTWNQMGEKLGRSGEGIRAIYRRSL